MFGTNKIHPRTVVSSVLLAGDHSLGVEETSVGTSSDLVNDIGLEVDLKDASDATITIKTQVLKYDLHRATWGRAFRNQFRRKRWKSHRRWRKGTPP